jgi:hypothetical protein
MLTGIFYLKIKNWLINGFPLQLHRMEKSINLPDGRSAAIRLKRK